MAKNEKVRIYSALEVARICGVVNQTAINWIKNGHLKAFQTPGGQYRVYTEDLVAFLTSRGMRVPPDLTTGETVQPDRDLVLIVDDDPQINTLLMRFLQKKEPGRRILQAFDGFEAGRLIADRRPEAVVLDIGLPGLDGHGLCRRIKEDASLARPVIVAISGLDQGVDGAVIIDEGADAFFAKPLDLEQLEARLRELVAVRRGGGGGSA
jgi:two-component system OmpR family response regulator